MSRLSRFFLRFVQVLIILTPIGVMTWLLSQAFVPRGVFFVRHEVNDLSPFVDPLLPDARARAPFQEEDGDWVQQITGDPVYFFAHPHRDFERADVELWFKNTGVPMVELGPLVNMAAESYDLRPIQNLRIDQSSWARLEQEGRVLLQREPVYDSLDAFFAAPPDRGRVATYHDALPDPYRISGYHSSPIEQTIDVSLRGFHEFVTYVKDETLRFDLRFMDMNREQVSDPVRAIVFNEDGDPVAEARAEDDGNVSDDARPSGLRELRLAAPLLPEGVYKVQLNVGRDIFFRSITSPQQKLTFLTNIYLADEVGYREPNKPVRFWTEAKHLRFVAGRAESMQEIQVGESVVRLTEPYVEYRQEILETGVVRVDVPRGDTIVRSDGHIAFSEGAWFHPDPVRLSADTDLDRLGVDFILTTYTPPMVVGEWFVRTVSFDTSRMAKEDETWKFVISAPGIDGVPAALQIGAIHMTWRGEPLTWRRFIDEIAEAIWTR
jgi:hypothetical protein